MAYRLDRTISDIGALGFDMSKLVAPFTVQPAGLNEMNAYYMPTDNSLVFGKSNGAWNLAEDQDIVVHEFGHLILDSLNPGMLSWGNEGLSLHEGFGDALAALTFDNPKLSESWGEIQGTASGAMRILNNDVTRDGQGDEPHDRGEVYAGLFWGLRETLRAQGVADVEALAACKQMLLLTGALLATSNPSPADIVIALDLALAHVGALRGFTPLVLETLQQAMLRDAARRGLIDDLEVARGHQQQAVELAEQLQIVLPSPDAAALATVLNQRLARGALAYDGVRTLALPGGLFKVTLQQRGQGWESDRFVSAIVDSNGAVTMLSADALTPFDSIPLVGTLVPLIPDADTIRRALQQALTNVKVDHDRATYTTIVERAIASSTTALTVKLQARRAPNDKTPWGEPTTLELYAVAVVGGVELSWPAQATDFSGLKAKLAPVL